MTTDSVANPTCPRPLRVGTLAEKQMLTGPLDRRRSLLSRARIAGLDHVFVADHISFFTGFGMDGLIQAATIEAAFVYQAAMRDEKLPRK